MREGESPLFYYVIIMILEVLSIQEIMHSVRSFCAVCLTGAAIPTIEFLFGEHTITKPLLVLFILLLVVDWVAGRRVATKTNTRSSRYGIDGLFRTGTMFVFLIVGNAIDIILGYELPIVFGLMMAMVLLPTIESVIANIKLAGWDSHIRIEWVQRIVCVLYKWVESEIEYKEKRILNRQREKGEKESETKSN